MNASCSLFAASYLNSIWTLPTTACCCYSVKMPRPIISVTALCFDVGLNIYGAMCLNGRTPSGALQVAIGILIIICLHCIKKEINTQQLFHMTNISWDVFVLALVRTMYLIHFNEEYKHWVGIIFVIVLSVSIIKTIRTLMASFSYQISDTQRSNKTPDERKTNSNILNNQLKSASPDETNLPVPAVDAMNVGDTAQQKSHPSPMSSYMTSHDSISQIIAGDAESELQPNKPYALYGGKKISNATDAITNSAPATPSKESQINSTILITPAVSEDGSSSNRIEYEESKTNVFVKSVLLNNESEPLEIDQTLNVSRAPSLTTIVESPNQEASLLDKTSTLCMLDLPQYIETSNMDECDELEL